MRDIDKYSEEALATPLLHVVKYNREVTDYGLTKITYDLMTGKHFHWLSIPTFGAASIACGIFGAMQYTLTNPAFNRYFKTSSGELLGNSTEEVASYANKEGIKCFNDDKFSDAKDWFNIAYQVSAIGSEKEKWFREKRESVGIIIEAHHFLAQNEFLKAGILFQNACNTSTEETIFAYCQKKQEHCEVALYKQGRDLWNEAWEAENDGRSDEAQVKFEKSKNQFDEAYRLAPELRGSTYQQWSEICGLKIEGNELFNQGVTLQQEGNGLRNQAQYVEACTKFEEAERKFREGFEISNDVRFQTCIEIVQESISAIRQVVEFGTTEQLATDLTSLTFNNASDRVTDDSFAELEKPTFPYLLTSYSL